MKSSQVVRWGILGCGDVTEKKSGPALQQARGSELVAVMRRNASAAEDYAKRHGVPRWYSSVADLLSDPEVDAVYIATPPVAHSDLALQVAASGKPCYVEKPMARTVAECECMLNAFKQAERPLYVAYYRRALPHFERVREWIRSERLGRLRQIVYDFASPAQLAPDAVQGWRYDPEIAGGGLFWDLGSHALDLFDHWAGAMTAVSGQMYGAGASSAVEEQVSLSGVTEQGVVISGSWNFTSPHARDAVCLRFEGGSVQCSVFGEPVLQLTDADGQVSQESFALPDSIQLPLIQNVVDSLLQGTPALSTGATALRANRSIEAVARTRG